MKRAILLVLVSTLLSLVVVSKLLTPVVASPGRIVVPDDYARIQDAYNNANEGDTIFVRAGIYHEHFVVRKTVSFEGENRDNTIIDGGGTGTIFYLTPSSDVIVRGLKIQNAGYGIFMYHTYFNSHVITDNTLTNLSTGIVLAGSLVVNNDISDNILSNNEQGLSLSPCKKNTISGNTIVNNTIGIHLTGSEDSVCKQNIISDNTIRNNDDGIHLSNYARGNTICRNNFIGNTHQVSSYGSINTWDSGIEGNYWSDYEGQDLDDDGIGEISYIIDEANQDRYPLMNPVEEDTSPPFSIQWWHFVIIAVGIVLLSGVMYFLKKSKYSSRHRSNR